MYKIMLADDEGVAAEALRVMISQNFSDECDIRIAHNDHQLIDIFQKYHPDIIFLNIQMTGVHGIFSIRELHALYHDCLFIVISYSRKTDYKREGQNLGVAAYITKPLKKDHIINILKKTFQQIDYKKKRLIQEQINKEKFESVVPIIESGMISEILLGNAIESNLSLYLSLLDISHPYAWIMETRYSQITDHGTMCNPIGSVVQLEKQIILFRRIIKAFFPKAVIGPVLANQIYILVPCQYLQLSEEAQALRKKRADNMTTQLLRKLQLNFRITLSDPVPLHEIKLPPNK